MNKNEKSLLDQIEQLTEQVEQLTEQVEQLTAVLEDEQKERQRAESEVASLRLSVRSYADVLRTIESDSAFVDLGGGLWLSPSTGQQIRTSDFGSAKPHILGMESTVEEAKAALKVLQAAGKAAKQD